MAVAHGRYGGAGFLVQSLLQATINKKINKIRINFFIICLHFRVLSIYIGYFKVTTGWQKYKYVYRP